MIEEKNSVPSKLEVWTKLCSVEQFTLQGRMLEMQKRCFFFYKRCRRDLSPHNHEYNFFCCLFSWFWIQLLCSCCVFLRGIVKICYTNSVYIYSN